MISVESAHSPQAQDPRYLQVQLANRLGPDVGVACRDVDGDPRALFAEEAQAIEKAIPRRQREFAAGRSAAREALAQIGWTPQGIACANDRSPVWPEGLVGSIAHCRSACVAIVAPREQAHAVGIDMEEDLPLDPSLWTSVCTPAERSFLASLPSSEQGRWGLRLFCAKEAYYKWQYPLTRRLLDFQEVEVRMDVEHSTFDVHAPDPVKSRLVTCTLQGRLHTSEGLVMAWLIGAPLKLTVESDCRLPEESMEAPV